MKQIFLPFFFVVGIAVWCTPAFAAAENIGPAGSPYTSDATGSLDGYFIDNGGAAYTLDVTAGFPNIFTANSSGGNVTNSLLSAVDTNHADLSSIVFSSSGTSNVYGTIGATATFANITLTGSTSVNFYGKVNTTTMDVATGSADFLSGTSNNAAVNFTGDGTVSLAANTTVVGALTTNTADTGTLSLASGSFWEGAVGGADGLKAVSVVGSGVSASITGAVNAYQFNLGSNILNVTGGVTIGNGTPLGVIDTTLVSASTYGQIVASGAGSITNGLTINPTVTGSIGVGSRFNILQAGSTPTGVLPIVISQTPGYTFTALTTSANGLITIVTQTANGIVTPPLVLTIATLPTLDTIATNVLGGISSLTDPIAIAQANAQLGPSAPSLAAPLVTFQGAREFENLWMSHLDMCSQFSYFYKDDPSCQDNNPHSGWWAKGFGYFGSQDARPEYNYAGYDSTIFGTMVAYDMPIGDNTRAGLGLGYAHTTIDGKTYETNSNTSFDTYSPTVYIGHEQGPWFIHGSESFGYNQYSAQRGIAIQGSPYYTANSDYSGEDYTTYVNGGYNFSAPLQLTVTPITSLQYSRVNTDSYTETGAGDLDLHAKPQGYDFLESGLGAKVERGFSVNDWTLVPEIHIEWLHDFINPTMGQTTDYTVGSPSTFTTGIKTDPDTLHAGTSISLLSCMCSKTKLSLEAGYDFYWRNDGYVANQVTMRITGRF